MAQRPGVEDALPRGDFLSSKVVGELCEPGNLIVGPQGVNWKILGLGGLCVLAGPRAGTGAATANPGVARKMERETGFEPATLSLEG